MQQHVLERLSENDRSTLQGHLKRGYKRKRGMEEFKMLFLRFTDRMTATALK